jgi:predicted CoA-binding protein
MLIDSSLISDMLGQADRIAIPGASEKPGRPVDRVARYLMDVGYEVVPVHPRRPRVWGLDAYPTLTEVPGRVDVVNLFRNPVHCPHHALETLQMNPLPALFWMQSGISSDDATRILAPHPIKIIHDTCIMVFHKEFLAS